MRKKSHEKKKATTASKKANDVWKKDASDYLPVSTHLYSKQEAQLEWAGKQHVCWVMKPSITFFWVMKPCYTIEVSLQSFKIHQWETQYLLGQIQNRCFASLHQQIYLQHLNLSKSFDRNTLQTCVWENKSKLALIGRVSFGLRMAVWGHIESDLKTKIKIESGCKYVMIISA